MYSVRTGRFLVQTLGSLVSFTYVTAVGIRVFDIRAAFDGVVPISFNLFEGTSDVFKDSVFAFQILIFCYR